MPIIFDNTLLPPLNVTVGPIPPPPPPPPSSSIKFHPGHYAGSNQICYASNAKWTQRQSEIDLAFKNNPNVLGYYDIHMWSSIETGFNSYNFFNVNQSRSYIASTYPGKRYGFLILGEDFNHTDPSQSLPGYMLSSSGTYGAGYNGIQSGYWQLGTYGSTAAWWRASVANRIIALMAALANAPSPYSDVHGSYTYDTDPYFEMASYTETALDLASVPGDYSIGASQTQWENINKFCCAAWKHTTIADQNNFFSAFNSSPTVTGNVMLVDITNRGAPSGPDIYTSLDSGHTFYDPQNAFTWGQLAYIGSSAGGTPGFSSQIGLAPYIGFVQEPDYGRTSVGDIMNSGIHVLKSPQIWWTVLDLGPGNAGDWKTLVLPAINGTAIPLANQVCPTNYVNAGGCNYS